MAKRYRVKVVVDNHNGIDEPERKYRIQEKWGFWWMDESYATTDKAWAYKTCEEMNMPYNKAKEKTNLN